MSIGWNDLPSPSQRWWGVPELAAMRRDYLAFIGKQQRLGDIVRLRILNECTVDLFDPELIRAAMVDHADALIRWERGPAVFAQLMGQSVLVTEGATWQRQRRMLMQAFTPKKVAGYAELMLRATDEGLAAVQAGEVAMAPLFSHLAMDVILRTLFTAPAAPHTQKLADAVQLLSDQALRAMFWPASLPDWLPLPGKAAKRRAHRLMHDLIQRHIDDRAGRPQTSDDLLGMLLALRDSDTLQGLSAREVYDQCMVSFTAGHETSATALTWWSALLAGHPDAQQRARAEVDAVLGGRAPGPEDLAALPYLSATLKEAMRLYPPIAALMTRRTTREIVLGDARLPARTMIRITPWLLHRDPRWWPSEPEAFRPERFLADAPDAILRGAYIPFGLGPRVCLGQHFAVLEMSLIAVRMLQRFHLHPVGALPLPRLAVTLRPADGVVLRLQARDSK
ncbi:MAG: cytochrome P450 [Polaromonas sp.]|nr:cytochrome P450 [Polaromonas sp.]